MAGVPPAPDPSGPTRSLPPAPHGTPSGIPGSVGPYRILGKLAQGGMGVVLRARDPKLSRDIALKMMLGGAWSGEDARRRFLQEARLLADLHHPGIVPVHDMGLAPEGPYFTMDLIEGKPLNDFLDAHRLSETQKLALMLKVCDAVHHAHLKGVIHRDLKPANILVTAKGHPVVLDFGIARLEQEHGQGATQTGAVIGTPAYMSPEQAQGLTREIDLRTDVYALGIVLYEMLTGRVPFEDQDTYALLKAVVEEEAPRPSRHVRSLDADLELVVMKAIAKEPGRRYDSARALADDLKRYLAGQPISARPDTAGYRARKWFRRHREMAVASAVGLLVVLVFGALGLVRLVRERDRAVRAEQEASRQRDGALAARREAEDQRLRAEAALARIQGEMQIKERFNAINERLALIGAMPPEEADRATAALLKEAPDHIWALLTRAGVLMSLKRQEEALALVEKALAKDPSSLYALTRRASMKMMMGHPEAALADYDRAIACPDAGAVVYHDRALLLHGMGRMDEARASCSRALDLQPSYPPALTLMALFECQEGRYEAALKKLDRSLEQDQTQHDAWNTRGMVLCELGRFEEAETSFKRALMLVKDVPMILINLGRAYEKAGRRKEAVEIYRKALELKNLESHLTQDCLARIRLLEGKR